VEAEGLLTWGIEQSFSVDNEYSFLAGGERIPVPALIETNYLFGYTLPVRNKRKGMNRFFERRKP